MAARPVSGSAPWFTTARKTLRRIEAKRAKTRSHELVEVRFLLRSQQASLLKQVLSHLLLDPSLQVGDCVQLRRDRRAVGRGRGQEIDKLLVLGGQLPSKLLNLLEQTLPRHSELLLLLRCEIQAGE